MVIFISIALLIAGIAVCIFADILLLGIGMIVLGIMILLTKILDGEGAGIIWGVGIGGYIVFLLIMLLSGEAWLAIGLIVLFLVIAAALIAAIVFVFIGRNKLSDLRESVKNAKSKARIAKAKYLTALRKADETDKEHGKDFNLSFVGSYQVSVSMVEKLSDNYEIALKKLTDVIEEYNKTIKHFPMIIVAKIFRYKPEEYVDEDNLGNSTELKGFDDSDI